MSKIEDVRGAMVAAMKSGDKARKDALSMLFGALKNAQIDKRSELTEDEANEVIRKEIRQTKESLDTAPADRTDIIEQCRLRIAAYEEFVPKLMDAEEIGAVIDGVLAELGIDAPTGKDKGRIMKVLMPKVKGKADGKMVNEVLSGRMQ